VPAPAGAVVALLERRGRFSRLSRSSAPGAPGGQTRRRGSARVVVGPSGSGRGSVRASAGDIVLVQPSARGSGARVIRVIAAPTSPAT